MLAEQVPSLYVLHLGLHLPAPLGYTSCHDVQHRCQMQHQAVSRQCLPPPRLETLGLQRSRQVIHARLLHATQVEAQCGRHVAMASTARAAALALL